MQKKERHMRGDWTEHYYHGYRIHSRIVPYPEGDYERWVAEVFSEGNRPLFRFILTISRTELAMRKVADEDAYLEHEGLTRVHARLDFGEFASGTDYNHTLTSSGEENSHPYHQQFAGLFATAREQLTYHALRVLMYSSEHSPGRVTSGDFDLDAWAYYLGVSCDDFIPVLRQLDEEGAVKAIWAYSPEITGAYKLMGGPTLLAVGVRLLEAIEQDLVDRRKMAVMPDLEESAFLIARILYDQQIMGSRRIVVGELRQLTGLTADDFDAADNFLLEARYCHGTMGGDDGFRTLSTDGVEFVHRKTAERFELSRPAEQLATFLAERQQAGRPYVTATEIKKALAWEDQQYFAAAEELIDEGLTEEKPRADNARLLGLALTVEGRRAVRRNFRRPSAPVALQMRDMIRVENYGDKVAIAAGQDSSAIHGLSGSEVAQLFQSVHQLIERRQDLSSERKSEIKDTVELIEGEVAKGEQANEKALTHYLRTLARMAPDIFDVAVAAATNPILAAATIVRKVAEKAKQDTGG